MKNHSLYLCLLFCMFMCTSMSATDIFTHVTDASTLKEGDQIIVVNRQYGRAIGTEGTTNRLGKTISSDLGESITTDKITCKVQRLTLKGSAGAWYFNTGDGYLCAGSNASNQLLTKEDIDDNAKAIIKIDTDGFAFIQFQGKYTRNIIRYDSYGETHFICYSSEEKYLPIQIYKKVIGLDGTNNTTTVDNQKTINDNAGKETDITVIRDMSGDGGYYTLTLPFSITREQINTVFGENTEVQEFTSVTKDESNTIHLNFTKITGSTVAGTPYLIKPTAKSVNNPTFTGITIVNDESKTISFSIDGDTYSFAGIYNPLKIQDEGNTRYLGGTTGNELKKPSAESTALKGLRAYFLYPSAEPSGAKVNMQGTTNGIDNIHLDDTNTRVRIYTVAGRYVGDTISGRERGIYIINGKKRIIK